MVIYGCARPLFGVIAPRSGHWVRVGKCSYLHEIYRDAPDSIRDAFAVIVCDTDRGVVAYHEAVSNVCQ